MLCVIPSIRRLTHGVLAALFALGAAHAFAKAPPIITIDGSSTVYPITEAVVEEYQLRHKARITVGISGTGGGFKKFCKGETDISNASRPISESEIKKCRENGIAFYELPIAFDALTIAVHNDNDWAKHITTAELKKIWEPSARGAITRWNQVRKTWPDAPLNLYGAGSDSGTFDYFTEAIMHKAKAQRGDYTASEDDNVLIQGLSKDLHALGYVPYSYYAGNETLLKAIPVDHGTGAVMPTKEHVVNGNYVPLSRPLFVYVNAASFAREDIATLMRFYLTEASPYIEEVKYVPLPQSSYQKLMKRMERKQTGSAFAGHAPVGLHVDEMLQRPPVN